MVQDEVVKVAPEAPPALDIDATFARIGGRESVALSLDQKLERRVAWSLLRHLEANGWRPKDIDLDEPTPIASPKEAMELIFNLDEVRLYVTDGSRTRWVLLIRGNSPEELVSDWSDASGDFGRVMDAWSADDCI